MDRKTVLIFAAAVLSLGGLIFIAASTASPALAGGPWALESVECQVDTKTIVVTGTVNSANPTVDDIYYNGRLVYSKNVQTDDMGEGHGSYIIKVPYLKLGAEVRVENRDGGPTVETVCVNAVPLNMGHGDHWAVLYRDQDEAGNPAIKVYCIIDGQGQYRGMFSKPEMHAVHKDPDVNLFIKSIPDCSVPIAAYVLTTGEYQINIGPDGEGKSAVTVFRKMPPVDVHYYDIDPNLPVWY